MNKRIAIFSTSIIAGASYYMLRKPTPELEPKPSTNFTIPLKQTTLNLTSNIAKRLDFFQIGSNNPIEDFSSHNQTVDGNIILAVYDGHAGPECARVLSEYLASYVAASIDKTPDSVISAIKSAFVQLDADLLKGGFKDETGNVVNAAVAGSCAALAYITATDVYAAVTGDCRVVLGRRSADATTHTLQLTQDQTVKNPREHERMLELHPGENVFMRGRVLGGLMPTRAFGDARYKWPIEVLSSLNSSSRRTRVPSAYLTPPYVTAEPEVIRHKLNPLHPVQRADGSFETVGDTFLVVACDGIFDELSSEDVVLLVDTHIKAKSSHDFDNAASHLVRNALQVAANDKGSSIQELLDIPPPQCRRYRDDMTAYVLHFGKSTLGHSLPPIDLKLAHPKKDALTPLLSKAKL